MAIDEYTIMGLINAYANSPEGKKKMDTKIKSYINGKDPLVNRDGVTLGGSKIMTRNAMKRAAKDLISMIISTAAQEGVPASVLENIESLDYTDPYDTGDGEKGIAIYITDDPKRPSLYREKYDGVDNIVAIFNNGYTADGFVYGKWHGKKTRSLDKRQGSFFMQKAIDTFMEKYGSDFNISVELNPLYDGAFGSE